MSRSTSSLELLLALDRGSGAPLRLQVHDQLRAAIRDGRLGHGVRLPSTRVLARDLGVSRGVVTDAYEQLAAEGWLAPRRGAGTSVAAAAVGSPADSAPRSHSGRSLRYDFRPGAPDLASFPRAGWLAAERRALRAAPDAALGYGDPRGAPELRAALADYLGRVRGVAAGAERVVVVAGFAQGLALLGRVLRSAGIRRLAIEDPSHSEGRVQIAGEGIELVPVPVDDQGIVVTALEQTGAGAVLVTPAHQFPTGVVLAPDRRAELLDWADREDAWVIEDDYDAEYRYDREPVGALQGLRPRRVIYGGSVSKTLAPALRLGWLVCPPALVDELREQKRLDDLGCPTLPQLALGDLVARGEYDRHLRRTRKRYRRRRDALLRSLARIPTARPVGIAAGLHLVAQLPEGSDELAICERAAGRSVGVGHIGEHRIRPGPPALLLGYARLSEAAITRGAAELARAMAPARA
jgi:GntR family transcriptional regulator / MocR family aminotransferase